MGKDPGWKLAMKIPDGWVQLPTGSNASPVAWAEQRARETLGAGEPEQRIAARASDLARLAKGARIRKDWYGFAYYPPFADGLVSLLDVKTYLPDRRYRTTTMEVLEEIFGGPSADTVGDFSVTRTELPGGQAVRVRRTRAEDPAGNGQATLIEGVTHAIRPPGIDGAVEVCMTWTVLQLGDRLAEMADDIASTVRVSPA